MLAKLLVKAFRLKLRKSIEISTRWSTRLDLMLEAWHLSSRVIVSFTLTVVGIEQISRMMTTGA